MPDLLYNNVSVLLTFLFVSFSWIFFRSENVSKAFYIIKHIFTDFFKVNDSGFILDDIAKFDLLLAGLFLVIMLYIENKYEFSNMFKDFSNLNVIKRWSVYLLFVFVILCFGVFENKQFIYFQF